tara:strand:- start:6707 stop:7045 length:339 start_codon:yes stop_codon:yes gene_type:complete
MDEIAISNDPTIVQLINDYGFPIVLAVGMGYFIYYVWQFISNELEPEIEKMHFALIRLIDQVRMLDQDMIRLQQKINVVLEYRERQKFLEDVEEKEALAEKQGNEQKRKSKR